MTRAAKNQMKATAARAPVVPGTAGTIPLGSEPDRTATAVAERPAKGRAKAAAPAMPAAGSSGGGGRKKASK